MKNQFLKISLAGCDSPHCSATLVYEGGAFSWESANPEMTKAVNSIFALDDWRPEDGDVVLWCYRLASARGWKTDLNYPASPIREQLSGITY